MSLLIVLLLWVPFAVSTVHWREARRASALDRGTATALRGKFGGFYSDGLQSGEWNWSVTPSDPTNQIFFTAPNLGWANVNSLENARGTIVTARVDHGDVEAIDLADGRRIRLIQAAWVRELVADLALAAVLLVGLLIGCLVWASRWTRGSWLSTGPPVRTASPRPAKWLFASALVALVCDVPFAATLAMGLGLWIPVAVLIATITFVMYVAVKSRADLRARRAGQR